MSALAVGCVTATKGDAGLADAGPIDAEGIDAGRGDAGALDGGACEGTNTPCALDGGGNGFCCSGACVDVSSDPANCNGCGLPCVPGQFCDRGACTPYADCATAQAWLELSTCELPGGGAGYCCNGGCQAGDTATDPMNCGGCGVVCPVGVGCTGGYCVLDGGGLAYYGDPGQTCPSGYSCAYQDCYLTTCSAGTPLDPCAANFGSYLSLGACCNQACSTVDDNQNCGSCGNACDAGSTCQYNVCVLTRCAPSDDGKSCAGGPGIGLGEVRGTCCGGTCTDLSQDPLNCGACGNACASGVCGDEEGAGCFVEDAGPPTGCGAGCATGMTCVGSSCVLTTCMPGQGGSCSLGGSTLGSCCYPSKCADLSSDPYNCGGCYFVCPAGQTCTQGACSGDIAPCGVGSAGLFCSLGDGGSGGCCPGSGCVDLATDRLNCGACSHACAADAGCSAARCH
jgi:hypothetical protein